MSLFVKLRRRARARLPRTLVKQRRFVQNESFLIECENAKPTVIRRVPPLQIYCTSVNISKAGPVDDFSCLTQTERFSTTAFKFYTGTDQIPSTNDTTYVRCPTATARTETFFFS